MRNVVIFVTAFCSVCVMSAGLSLLCPSSKLEKSVKYVFSLVFLVCLLSALPGLKNIKIEYPKANFSVADSNISSATAQWNFEYLLRANNIEFSKIEVCTDKNAEGGIIINKVIIYSSESAENIRELLGGEDIGYAVEIIGE